MTPRILALTLLVAMLGFAGLMASVGFLVREPLPILAPHQRLELRSEAFEPPVTVAVLVDGRFRVDLVLDSEGAVAPSGLALAPAGGEPIAIEWRRVGETRLEGSGQLTRPGRWEVTLATAATRDALPFILRE